jgi:hypothetical protein
MRAGRPEPGWPVLEEMTAALTEARERGCLPAL